LVVFRVGGFGVAEETFGFVVCSGGIIIVIS
jgi:hypothetical protein